MTNRKKSYSIDPKEYEEDGLLYDNEYAGLDSIDDSSYTQEGDAFRGYKESHAPQERTYETPRQQIKRLKNELYILRRKVEKLSAFKRRAEAYDAYYTVNLKNIEYVRVSNPYGCKEAYLELMQDLEDSMANDGRGNLADYSTRDTEYLRKSKAYLVFSPNPYCGMDLLLEDMQRCRLERLGVPTGRTRLSVGCLLLSDGDCVFFWPKVLHDPNEDCTVDYATDTQSKGL